MVSNDLTNTLASRRIIRGSPPIAPRTMQPTSQSVPSERTSGMNPESILDSSLENHEQNYPPLLVLEPKNSPEEIIDPMSEKDFKAELISGTPKVEIETTEPVTKINPNVSMVDVRAVPKNSNAINNSVTGQPFNIIRSIPSPSAAPPVSKTKFSQTATVVALVVVGVAVVVSTFWVMIRV